MHLLLLLWVMCQMLIRVNFLSSGGGTFSWRKINGAHTDLTETTDKGRWI
ncbi:hypothetical protein GPEL0_01r2546 [Geoanaerobacter pelophilus]|uniref:Uncharacterized protein n=1 Tax=Geoanaerobacter pelophilus TaxID=60036 RepID=A0ABQ0MJF6_9BACT|nr:hypothetical protein GPEL0_01r2546 [Geoanaerobacter pelophilus]